MSSMKNNPCSLEQLEAMLDGRLAKDEKETLDKHLERCTACQQTLTAWKKMRKTMLNFRTIEPSERFYQSVLDKTVRKEIRWRDWFSPKLLVAGAAASFMIIVYQTQLRERVAGKSESRIMDYVEVSSPPSQPKSASTPPAQAVVKKDTAFELPDASVRSRMTAFGGVAGKADVAPIEPQPALKAKASMDSAAQEQGAYATAATGGAGGMNQMGAEAEVDLTKGRLGRGQGVPAAAPLMMEKKMAIANVTASTGMRRGEKAGAGTFQTFVIRSAAEWPSWVDAISVDWSRSMVVGVLSETQQQTGVYLTIADVRPGPSGVTAYYRYEKPSAAAEASSPYQSYCFRVIDRTTVPILFEVAH